MSAIHGSSGDDPPIFRELASFGSDVDLTAVSGAPPWQPVRLEIHNDEDSTQPIVLAGADGEGVSFEVPADSVRVVRAPVFAIESSGTGTIAQVIAYWRYDGSKPLND